jgi:hypothetical protein
MGATRYATQQWLTDYTVASNFIEGIDRDPVALEREVNALDELIGTPSLGSVEMLRFLSVVEPTARIRAGAKDGVAVGSHVAPAGGPHMYREVADLLIDISRSDTNPVFTYAAWQHLHPLTDGNGRTGRALYAWQNINRRNRIPLPSFVHDYHYEVLSSLDRAVVGKGWRGLVVR